MGETQTKNIRTSVKIAIDIRHLSQKNQSGVGHYTLRLINELAKLSPNDEFILFAAGSKKTLQKIPTWQRNNITLVKTKIYNRLLNLLLLLRLRTLESFLPTQPDIWFFPNVNIVYTRLTYAITVHDISFVFLPDVFTFKQILWHKVAQVKKLVQNSYIVLAVSKSTQQDLEEHWQIDTTKIFVTPLGVTADFQAKQQPHDQTFLRVYQINFPYFLTLSTLEPRKNLESVVEAYTLWRARTNKKTHLVVAGAEGWKTKNLYKLASVSPFANDIHFIGYVEDKHRPTLFRQAEAFLFPSYWEGFGLPALEAIACGTPTIASFMSSMPEVVGQAGLLVDPFVPSDIADALQILDSETTRANFKHLCTEQARLFTWNQTAERTLSALKTIKI